jgi:uncharacterized protein (DUF2252 family)
MTRDQAVVAEPVASRPRSGRAVSATGQVPHLTVEERLAIGRQWRDRVPRQAHAAFDERADRPDPVAILEGQAIDRLPDLVPIRYGRMATGPFAFLRGSAGVMAADLAPLPRTGLEVQLCGDAHIANFGVYATPERSFVLDINDFDETRRGPFEWDVKRFAASAVVAARQRGMKPGVYRPLVLEGLAAYRTSMRAFAKRRWLQIWYDRITLEDLRGVARGQPIVSRALDAVEARARTRDSLLAYSKLTEDVGGERRIREAPPLVERVFESAEETEMVRVLFRGYRRTLQGDRRRLLERFRIIDIARKVVGVGSVGTRCFVLYLEGRDEADPLFLQVKQAYPSVLDPYLGASVYENQGQRVVEGQRMMQAASDIFLGWIKGPLGRNFYLRQLYDGKWSADLEGGDIRALGVYLRVCARAMARAHARSGDPVALSAYLGNSPTFDKAILAFSEAYNDQTVRDHAALEAAIDSGRVAAVRGV